MFVSVITSEQVNDYVMIHEYQGEINMQTFCVTSHDLLYGAMEGQMHHILYEGKQQWNAAILVQQAYTYPLDWLEKTNLHGDTLYLCK